MNTRTESSSLSIPIYGFNSFPKIFTLGQPYILDIFKDEVEITEKVDGSQFAFGILDGQLRFRSKGREFVEPDALFNVAHQQVLDISNRLLPNTLYYGEYLKTPKHNVLKYDRVPERNIALFGAYEYETGRFKDYNALCIEAVGLGMDVVPILFQGRVNSIEQIEYLLEKDSFLGGAKIEGFVVKNYLQHPIVGGAPLPLAAGKFVSEKFKEVHKATWKGEHTPKGNWDSYVRGYRTEARWNKSIQHALESGTLLNGPQDIGPLIRAINKDIEEECKEEIKEKLWELFRADLLRTATQGFPEWYKEQLLKKAVDNAV